MDTLPLNKDRIIGKKNASDIPLLVIRSRLGWKLDP